VAHNGYTEVMVEAGSEEERALMKRWVDQWKYVTGPELERIKKEELRAMTEEDAFDVARRLSSYESESIWIEPSRFDSAGLIEQQRLFSKLHPRTS
jgi:hypothetical protein